MRLLTALDKEAADLLLGNATDFLNGALEIIFKNDVTSRQMKIAISSIQTCFELLAKYRIVREKGVEFVIRGEVPAGNLLDASSRGIIKTITFTECLKLVEGIEPFTDMERELVAEVQNTRNALAHFSATVEIEDCRRTCAWLTIRALSMFAAGADRDQGEMQNHSSFLDGENFHRLTSYEPYRDEAVDAALDNIDSEDVYRCWECLDDALCLRPSETYFCYCCGLTAGAWTVGFANCPKCAAGRGVCFDPLNDQGGNTYHGKCLHCGEVQRVSEWTDFGEDHSRFRGVRGRQYPQK